LAPMHAQRWSDHQLLITKQLLRHLWS
jgi:hypothetical protein